MARRWHLPPLPSGERVGVRGGGSRERLSVVARFAKSFRAPAAPELLSLCVAKEKGHPGWRLPGVLPGKSVRRGRAFRAGSCPREKASPSLDSPAARPGRPRLTAAQGPRKSRRASCAPEATAKAERRSLRGALALLKSARRKRAALPGAPMARRAGGGKSAGWPAGSRPVFRRYMDVPSKNPVTRPRIRNPWMGAGRAIGVSFPLGYFSFGQAKEK